MAYLNVIITIEVLSRQNWSSKEPSDLFNSVGVTVNNRYTLSIVLYAVVRYFIYVLRTMRRVSIFKPSTCRTRTASYAKSLWQLKSRSSWGCRAFWHLIRVAIWYSISTCSYMKNRHAPPKITLSERPSCYQSVHASCSERARGLIRGKGVVGRRREMLRFIRASIHWQ